MLVLRARVGARAEVTKNDLGKVSRFLVAKQLTISLLYVRAYVRTDQLAFFNITQPYQFRFKRDKGQRWSNNLIQLNYQQT